MGSPDKGTGIVDCSVGTIVWVRRRNGSWWPGKILGSEELSAAHLMSPRSGTPVKLLGREDASVDWYNLEKSKRVKAFRCGEFDECIERAESSQGLPPKKREKYARREDAILHALELEKQMLEKKYGKLGCSSNGKSSISPDAVDKELLAPAECSGYGNGDGKHVHSKSNCKKLDLSLEDKVDHSLYAQQVKEGSKLAGDEDNSEVVLRMRGLQDLGLRTGPSKRKLSSSISSSGCWKSELDDDVRALPSGGLSTDDIIQGNSKNSMDKKRKSHEPLSDESLARRRDRRRPLVQVLQNSAKLPVDHCLQQDNAAPSVLPEEQQMGDKCQARSRHVGLPIQSSDCSNDKQFGLNKMSISPSHIEGSSASHPNALVAENASGSTENTETDSLGSDADEETGALSDADVVTELEPKSLGRCRVEVQHASMKSEEPDEVAVSSYMSPLSPQDPVSVMGVSKWQLKGKRNNRALTKRSVAKTDRRVSGGTVCGATPEERESDSFDESDLIEKNFSSRRDAFDNRGHLLTSKTSSKGLDDTTHNIINWEDLAWNDHQPVMKGYWEDSSNYFDPVFIGRRNFGGRINSMLVDVDLKVQSSYQREHVPMISLMSKLNGQAIVGHPIQIEALENGSSEILLSDANDICPEPLYNERAVTSMWRTARRTANFRIPRPHPRATLDGEEIKDHDQDKGPLKKSNVGDFGHKTSVMRKSLSHSSHPPSDRKHSKKPPKKISLSSSQKIKTLSSIGKEQKFGNNDLKHGIGTNSYQVDGLIKGASGPTTVACIPVKLVFSRLYEELVGRHQ
ncbi:uncharacterized protein At1g51745 isoform X2 [Diospyros lotus]|uniref:uncharacterized protein At1g51745 isoform X2 n=1 Tax=Diospyros lotus TaxID=55363 RepID=UPI00224D1B0D|nr:uncharacterized protein At1g51745 isoform X2 [Diospyros lotus]